jgi:hypothetical protein
MVMLDLLVIVVSLAFFIAMIWFARACDVL